MAAKHDIATDLLKLSEKMTQNDIEESAKKILEYFGEGTRSILKALRISDELREHNITVISARELTNSQKERIAKALNQELSVIMFIIDSSLIGGIVIKKGDTVIDSSLSSKLNGIKDFLSRTYINPRS